MVAVLLCVGLLVLPVRPGAAAVGDVSTVTLPSTWLGAGTPVEGPGGTMWFTGRSSPSGALAMLGRVTSAGVHVSPDLALDTQGAFTAPVLAGDGAFYVGQTLPRQIRRVPTTGSQTVFPWSTSAAGFPQRLTLGPDGAIWFTTTFVTGGYRIGRLGVGASFPTFVVSQVVDPTDIVAGSDGNVWYVGERKIGRMTTAGVVTTFDLPSPVQFTGGLADGPDGALWWTDVVNDLIGRTDPATGTSTTFPLPAGMDRPTDIVAGPDQNLWFTIRDDDALGRITPAGVVTVFPIPQVDAPVGLVVGPDERLWVSTGDARFHRFTIFGSPSAPTGLAATPGNGQVSLSWGAPTETGGSPITAYRIFRNGQQVHETANGSTLSHTVTGLTNGQASTFTVAAVNADGQGTSSSGVPATPVGPPGAPNLTAAVPGNGQVALTWTAPASNGGSPITAYRIFRGGDQVHQTTNGSTTSHTVTGLTNGQASTFTVRAVNAVGASAASNGLGATPRTVPGAPTLVSATPGDGQVSLSWTTPATDGGAAVTSFRVLRNGVQVHQTANASTTSHTVTGLVNGQAATYSVRAVNVAGDSAASNTLAATPDGPVPSPTFVDVATTHPFFADVEWMAAEGISTGFPPGPEYRPGIAVSRAAMSAFMYRLAGAPSFVAPSSPTFGDVAPSHPFSTEVEWMASEGITTGTAASPKPLYKPADPVSRGAMSAFMYRLAGSPSFVAPSSPTFGDVAPSHPFSTEVEWMASEGITTGTAASPKPLYKPSSPVSRGAMSAFMHRLADGPGVGV